MIRPVILVLSLTTLLVCISAIPKLIENNEHVASLYQKKSAQDVQVGAWWDHQGVHNLTVGYKSYQDRLLFSSNINKPSKTMRVITQNVVVKSSHGERISFIEAYDLHTNQGDAGYASVISGGPGSTSVTIHLKSARNHGLKYYVRVFGHY